MPLNRLLLCMVLGCASALVAVEAPKTETKPANFDEVGPKPAAVSFVGGLKIEKCWFEGRPTGAWITYDSQRFWYVRSTIADVKWLPGEPDNDLKEWLKKVEEARKKEEERVAKADEEREKKAHESETPPTPPVVTGQGGTTTAGPAPSAPGAQTKGSDKPGKQVAVQNDGGNRGSDNDGNRRVAGGGYVNSGGSGIVGGNGIAGGGDGIITGANAHLGYQWRVKEVHRKEGTIRIKNRLFQQHVTLKVKDPEDLKHVKVNQILQGTLSVQQPFLTAPDGTAIEFDLSLGATP